MPAPGDQHRETPVTANPFAERVPRINEYTAQEIATLQSRLDKQLGPEYISSRPGAGGTKVHYIAAEKVINLANEVFGFNGWSSQIQNVTIDFVDENQSNGKISLGLSTIVRVTLKDGTFHEDIGYGMIENCKGKAAAFEKAKKEGVTDALKRSLRNFGNVLGNCLYDKEFLGKITKVKVAPTKWDTDNLHRHPDFAPPKNERIEPRDVGIKAPPQQDSHDTERNVVEGEDEFGGDLFDGVEFTSAHPDEVVLPPQNNPPYPTHHDNPPNLDAQSAPIEQRLQPVQKAPLHSTPPNQLPSEQPQMPASHNTRIHEPPVGFITSRAAEMLKAQPPPSHLAAALPRFDPAAESPSIRKTSGINHSVSAPVSKTSVHPSVGGTTQTPNANSMPPPHPPPQQQQHHHHQTRHSPAGNVANPSENLQRRIGAPGVGAGSPLGNRQAYRPPTMAAGGGASTAGSKRPLPSATEGGVSPRPPLADVSNVTGNANVNAAAAAGGGKADEGVGHDEMKRTKIGDA